MQAIEFETHLENGMIGLFFTNTSKKARTLKSLC